MSKLPNLNNKHYYYYYFHHHHCHCHHDSTRIHHSTSNALNNIYKWWYQIDFTLGLCAGHSHPLSQLHEKWASFEQPAVMSNSYFLTNQATNKQLHGEDSILRNYILLHFMKPNIYYSVHKNMLMVLTPKKINPLFYPKDGSRFTWHADTLSSKLHHFTSQVTIILIITIVRTSSHPTSWKYILIFFYLHLGLPSGLFPFRFSDQQCVLVFFSPMHSSSLIWYLLPGLYEANQEASQVCILLVCILHKQQSDK